MTPAQERSAPSSKTACSQCTWQKSRRPSPSKSRSTPPERARRGGRGFRPPLTPSPMVVVATQDAVRPAATTNPCLNEYENHPSLSHPQRPSHLAPLSG